jgi:hypothetical protein
MRTSIIVRFRQGNAFRHLVLAALFAACFVLILASFKVLPGHAPSAQYLVSDATFADCFHQSRASGLAKCLNFGFPKGAPKTFGIPVSIAGSLLVRDGFVSLSSILLIYGVLILVAYVGAISLFMRITRTTWLSIIGATLYLASISIYKYVEYGALGLGIALIPFYLAVDLRLMDAVGSGSKWKALGWFTVAVIARVFSVFLDGYSFLFSTALSFSNLLLVPLLARNWKLSVKACAVYFVVCLIAAVSFRLYFPSDALGSTPMDGFRAQGVDVFGLVSPQPDSLYNRWLGIGGPIDPLITYSDGASSRGVFLGYAWILSLAAIFTLLVTRRSVAGLSPYLAPICFAGLAALALSLGPSLKYKSYRDAPAQAITASHYSMPEDAAVMSLPTALVYQHVPGVKTARALVRWLTLTRLAIVTLVLVAALTLLNAGHRLAASALLLLALFEIAPDFTSNLQDARRSYARAHTLYYAYPDSLRPLIHPGERALFLELHDDPGGNQYTVNTLCARTGLICYNTGGDKASVVVRRQWPVDVLNAANFQQMTAAVDRMFANKLVDVIIVPFFDLRRSAYAESQGAIDVQETAKAAQQMADAFSLDIEVGERFALLRPRPSDEEADRVDRCGVLCWRAWPEMSLQAPKWGPRNAISGQGINLQPDGRSLIWVDIRDDGRTYGLALGETRLGTQRGARIITGSVPKQLIDSFIPGAEYPFYLLDTSSETKLFLGNLKIAPPQ